MSNFLEMRSVFLEVVGQAIGNLSDQNAMKVRAKLIEIVGSWTAPYLFSRDHFTEKNDEIFADEVFRDWLFNVRFMFFTHAAMVAGQEVVGFMIDTLARNASLDLGADSVTDVTEQELIDLSGMPEQFPQEILGYEAAKKMLAANNWAVVILLSIAFIPLGHEVLQTPSPDNNQNK